jgi:uncharacterized C2H2 Zn-finger protein
MSARHVLSSMGSRSSDSEKIDCPRCSRQFLSRSALSRHLRRIHGRGDTAVVRASSVTAGEQQRLPPEEHYWWVAFEDRIEQYQPVPADAGEVDRVDLDPSTEAIEVVDEDGAVLTSVDTPDVPVDPARLDWGTSREGYVRLTFRY